MELYRIDSGFQSGVFNMALDEALLEFVRRDLVPRLIVRTYGWEVPTLSLGVNQAVRDIQFLMDFYGKPSPVQAVVRRPTGGRAILHGEDISYSFITNDPAVLKLNLNDSYCIYAGLVRWNGWNCRWPSVAGRVEKTICDHRCVLRPTRLRTWWARTATS
jgi:lipoate-protein ligase A